MANRKPISHSTSDNPAPGGHICPVWIDPAQDTIDGRIYVSQDGVVLGRTSTGAGAHEEILISSLGGGSGGGITSKTYAEMAALIAADGLTAGAFYLITDAFGTDLGFLTYAATTNAISVSGVGGYLNADFQGVADYANTPTTFVAQQGIWSADNEGGYSEGDVVIWNLLHWQLTNAAAVDGTDPETNTTAYTILDKATYPETYVTAWDTSEFDFTNNWLQYRADLRGNSYLYTKAVDDSYFGYSETTILSFRFGDDNVTGNRISNGVFLNKNNGGLSCLNNQIGENCGFYEDNLFKGEMSGNILSGEASILGNTLPAGSSIKNNRLYGQASISSNSLTGSFLFENNVFNAGGGVTGNTGDNLIIFSNTCFNDAFIRNNIAGAGAFISSNTLYQGAEINTTTIEAGGGVVNNSLSSSSNISGNTVGPSASIAQNAIALGGTISNNTIGDGSGIASNILENGAQLTGITAGKNCSISRNKIGQGATLGGSTTMGDGSSVNDNAFESAAIFTELTIGASAEILGNKVGAGGSISNGTFGEYSSMSYNQIGPGARIGDFDLINEGSVSACFLHSDSQIANFTGDGTNGGPIYAWLIGSGFTVSSSPYTLSDPLEKKRVETGFSNFKTPIDITGLTTADLLAENNYVGIFNLTSSSSTETIDSITNAPTLFPITIRPAAGLALTITGTALSGIAAGQIALTTADITLDGDKGEYIILEIDPFGTGYLVEKQRVAGLI